MKFAEIIKEAFGSGDITAVSIATTGLTAHDTVVGVWTRVASIPSPDVSGKYRLDLSYSTAMVNAECPKDRILQAYPYHGISEAMVDLYALTKDRLEMETREVLGHAYTGTNLLLVYNLDFLRNFLARELNTWLTNNTRVIEITALVRLAVAGRALLLRNGDHMSTALMNAIQHIGPCSMPQMYRMLNIDPPTADKGIIPHQMCDIVHKALASILNTEIPVIRS